MICFYARLIPNNANSDDDTHNMGVGMGENVMWV
jgi:hypothetical protein